MKTDWRDLSISSNFGNQNKIFSLPEKWKTERKTIDIIGT